MLILEYQAGGRSLPCKNLEADLVVVGGGLAGVCCSITAAREGLRVLLVQDRPVLGGNASSEVRLWVLGATSHMGNNNRWAREGGVIDEILVENMWRNPEGNAIIFDALLLEWVTREANITLLLNSAVHSIQMNDRGGIARAQAYCSQNETVYWLSAPLFCDASGDGILGYLSGATFRVGAEAAYEFEEGLAGPEPKHELLGHSIYFYSRDTGRPVAYVPPAFALMDITKIPRYRDFRVSDSGCRLWWLEYGGDLDTVHDTEAIKWELWRIAHGVWNYIKNSGEFPDAANLTLEWKGTIPGKRETRRFEGDYILSQKDVVDQRQHFDAVSLGGWAIDLHPPEGVYSTGPACTQWHSKGVYQIPYRVLYSRDIPNLFLAGRIISTSHIAFGSTRVMATCAHNAQAVGMAAAMCIEEEVLPRQVTDPGRIQRLQQRLLQSGQHIPGVRAIDSENQASSAQITASSTLALDDLPPSGELRPADMPCALLLPLLAGPVPEIRLIVDAATPAPLRAELWRSSREGNATPDIKVACATVELPGGRNLTASFRFGTNVESDAHIFFIVQPAPGVSLHLSKAQFPGVLTLWQRMNGMVAKSSVQTPPQGSGIDSFAFWLPERRPAARNLAVTITPPVRCCEPRMVINGWSRPWCGVNAWAPAREDRTPWLRLAWNEPRTLRSIQVTFDTDFDHPMESVLMGHPERVMPGCVTALDVRTLEGELLAAVADQHHTRWRLALAEPITTAGIDIALRAWGPAPPAIFEVRCN